MNTPGTKRAFTMVELLIAVTILMVVTTVTYLIFSAVTEAWRRGGQLSEDLHHGDFVMEQIVGGLQSARYRTAADGFRIDPEGDQGFSWVKEGTDLVGDDSGMAKTFHRVHLFMAQSGADDGAGIAYTAWGDDYLQPDDFHPEDLPPVLLSRRVVGIGCRVATNATEDGIQWLESWDQKIGLESMTSHVPRFVEVTLRLQPLKEGEPPIEIQRCVQIPIAQQKGYR